MVQAHENILERLDETIRLHKDIDYDPYFFNRLMQRLEDPQPNPVFSFQKYLFGLLRPIPVAILVIIGIMLGVLMVDSSEWASYNLNQNSIASSDEVYNAFYQGDSDQSFIENYLTTENTSNDE